jgi:hypothetical protein
VVPTSPAAFSELVLPSVGSMSVAEVPRRTTSKVVASLLCSSRGDVFHLLKPETLGPALPRIGCNLAGRFQRPVNLVSRRDGSAKGPCGWVVYAVAHVLQAGRLVTKLRKQRALTCNAKRKRCGQSCPCGASSVRVVHQYDLTADQGRFSRTKRETDSTSDCSSACPTPARSAFQLLCCTDQQGPRERTFFASDFLILTGKFLHPCEHDKPNHRRRSA